ncbi:histidine kinase [Marinilongibacter aquaticus]|uniref:sensor histidine kinase n=1 Tax=Marinilongibacter aquaticus TaxID=2975157 RepID=UPI0021BD8E29|nr:histidine kinase [Marinilongibacter aquaticus]UBM60904.1 histidine kinase [Marinilongibacter aquaticus]
MTLPLLTLLLGLIPPQLTIKTEALKSYVSDTRDSVYLQGLENRLEFAIDTGNVAQFAYRLHEFDTEFHTSIHPVSIYTNIPGGNYSFEYRIDGIPQPPISVSVLEAIWQKWWFWPMIGGYILLLAVVGTFLFLQYNYRQKLKVAHLRNQIASDLHDEVGSNLSSIAIYTEVLKKKLGQNKPDLLPLLNKITGNSTESVILMRDTVWALKPDNDNLSMMLERIGSFGKEILSEKRIGFSQKIDTDLSKIHMDMQARKNCYLILKEALNNIVKHADAKHATLHAFQKSGKLCFEISDDGKGFDQHKELDGNGLRNFKERAEESGFEINIVSQANRGTQILLIISP